jgi:hypothetical protein
MKSRGRFQETEYTGSGTYPTSWLTFPEQNGIEVRRGDPGENIPGKNIVIPEKFDRLGVKDMAIDAIYQAVLLHLPELLGQHLLGNARD